MPTRPLQLGQTTSHCVQPYRVALTPTRHPWTPTTQTPASTVMPMLGHCNLRSWPHRPQLIHIGEADDPRW
jgi:hypothetical protein